MNIYFIIVNINSHTPVIMSIGLFVEHHSNNLQSYLLVCVHVFTVLKYILNLDTKQYQRQE